MKFQFQMKPQIKWILAGILSLLAMLDMTGILPFGALQGILAFAVIILGITVLLSYLEKKYPRKELVFLKKAILVIAVIEATVFQFNAYHLFGGNYPEMTLDLSKAEITNFDLNSHENIAASETVLEFKDLNVPVGTLTFEASSSQKNAVRFTISIKDDTFSAMYRNGIANATVLRDHAETQTVPCNFSGTVHDLRISFTASDGEYIHLENLIINRPVYFHFSFLRFFIFLFLTMMIYFLTASPVFQRSFSENKKLVFRIAYVFTGILLVSALVLTNSSRYRSEDHSLYADFHQEGGDQMTKELVDAFEAGHTWLDNPVNENLTALENPYDDSQRTAGKIGGYPWDHLLFEGKYYSYYGIAPVLLLFLPYHLITGYYFPNAWAVLLFGMIGIIFMTKFYLSFMDTFFSHIRSSLILSGLVLMQLSSGIWFCFNNTMFYEIAQNSGFAATMTGAYFLISSHILDEKQTNHIRLALSSVFLSLAVLCRPTLAVYCFCAVFCIFIGFLKIKKETTKTKTKYLLSALLPFVLIGAVQMLYNYARFHSFFDFGIQYSLTINDFTSSQYHTHFALIGIFNYVFNFPSFSERFPFLNFGSINVFNPQGYYFVATFSAGCLLWKVPELLAYGRCRTAYRLCEHKNKKLYAILLLAVCVICPLVIMFSIWESGYGSRYCVDFAWQMIIGAFVICFVIYPRCKENMQKLLNKLMTITSVSCLVLVFAQTYNWIVNALSLEWQADLLAFARLFEFWI